MVQLSPEHSRAIEEARVLFSKADALIDAAHRLLDNVVGPLMDDRDIVGLQVIAHQLPTGFHKSEIQLFINHIRQGVDDVNNTTK